MNELNLLRSTRLVPVLVTLVLAAAIVWLVATDRPLFSERTPEDAEAPQDDMVELGKFWEEGTRTSGPGSPADIPGTWPRFRGANGTNALVDPSLSVIESWGASGPRELWSLPVAEGYAGAVVRAGRVYLLDYDEGERRDVVRCLSLADGAEIWRYTYPNRMKRNFGYTRTVPAVSKETVVTIGPRGQVVALDASTGDLRWALALSDRYHARLPRWYMGQCPLIVDGAVILAPGGDALITALDEITGETLWETPNLRRWEMTHSSVTLAELDGVRQLIYPASDGVVSVSVQGGEVLWELLDWNVRIANVPAPVQVGEDHVLFVGGYGVGARMVGVKYGTDYEVSEVFRLDADIFGSHVHTPIWHRDLLFGVNEDHDLLCLNSEGKEKWRSDKGHRLGLGPFVALNDHIFMLNESGTLSLISAQKTGFSVVAEANVLDKGDAWGPMALAGGRLILRDAKTMKCLEVATNEETPNRWVEVGAFDTGLTRVRGVAVAQDDGKEEILVAGDREIRVFDAAGLTIRRHKLAAEPFAVAAVDSGEMWVAFDRHVEAFDSAGRLTAACDPRGQRSALAGLTVSDDFIYVGDAGLRLIHRYDREMRYQDSFPEEPDDEARLAVPSRYLDAVAAPGELVFVLNPGRHRVAAYSHGRKAFHWGTPGRSEDEFPGCCNPIALAVLPGGDLVTGEKGQVLVKRFTPEGVFVEIINGPDSFADQGAACARGGLSHRESGIDLATDGLGRVFVLDPCSAVVHIYARDGGGDHG